MAVSEESRHALHRRLDEVLGPDHAVALMEYLPPVGWADIATKHDLSALEERIDLRFQKVDLRFDAVDKRFDVVDERFNRIEQGFDDAERRWDERFSEADRRWDERFSEADRRWDERFSGAERRWDERFSGAEARGGERLENLRLSLSSDLHQELATISQSMASQFRAVVFTVVMAMIGIAGVVVGAMKA